jgi:hypothetical protein
MVQHSPVWRIASRLLSRAMKKLILDGSRAKFSGIPRNPSTQPINRLIEAWGKKTVKLWEENFIVNRKVDLDADLVSFRYPCLCDRCSRTHTPAQSISSIDLLFQPSRSNLFATCVVSFSSFVQWSFYSVS